MFIYLGKNLFMFIPLKPDLKYECILRAVASSPNKDFTQPHHPH